MNDVSLEDRIRSAGAVEFHDTERLDAQARLMALNAMTAARKRPRMSRPAVLLWGVAALLVVGTSAAAAAPTVFGWLDFTPQYTTTIDATVDGRGPYHCEYALRVTPGAAGETARYREIVQFVETRHWAIPEGVIALHAPTENYHNDLGVIAHYMDSVVVSDLTTAFPDWEQHLEGIEAGGSCTPNQTEWPVE